MKFRRQTSFNRRDSVVQDGERIVVQHDMRQRCELVLQALSNGQMSVSELTVFLNSRRRNRYTECDVKYALRKLVKERVVEQKTNGVYGFTGRMRSAMQRWQTAVNNVEYV